MSSDIWHYHRGSSGFANVLNTGPANNNRSKRSRSVLAMPNHSSEISRDLTALNRSSAAAAVSPGAQLLNSGVLRRPTYSSPSPVPHNKQYEDSISQEQQWNKMGEELINDQNRDPNSQQAISGNSGSKQHGGPMGIFFKVWSLVKVTKGRHQHRQQQRQAASQMQQNGARQYKLRRQNSEDNSNYTDYPRNFAAILQDQHFRRAGSQPVASTAVAAVNRLQVSQVQTPTTTTGSSSCTSSGVSSTTSSTLAAISNGSPTTSSSSSPFRRRHFNGALANSKKAIAIRPHQQQQQGSWVARMKRDTTNSTSSGISDRTNARLATADSTARRRYSGANGEVDRKHQKAHLLSLSLSTSDGSRSSSELRDEPEEEEEYEPGEEDDDDDEEEEGQADCDENEGEEEESNDIYTTPHDSIQSVPSGQRAPSNTNEQQYDNRNSIHQPSTSQAAYPIIKSFSTNNFHQAQAQAGSSENDYHQQKQQAAHQDRENSNDCSRKQRLNGSRFFISSSSSEDSQATKQFANGQKFDKSSQKMTTNNDDQKRQPLQQVTEGKLRVSVNQGVHCHGSAAGPMRPQSLLLAASGQESINQFLVPVQMLTPMGIGVGSPSTATVYLGPSGAAAAAATTTTTTYLRAPASMGYQRSPSLFEFLPSTRFSSKYPPQLSSFQQQQKLQHQFKNNHSTPTGGPNLNQSRQSIDSNAAPMKAPSSNATTSSMLMPNSISMYDFKQANSSDTEQQQKQQQAAHELNEGEESEYKLAEMMLESGSNPNARDALGNTTLMLAVLSDNLPAVKCLIEHGANVNETNLAGLGALDLICTRQATSSRLEILKTLIDNGADLDRQRESDGSRLLDRLIKDHQSQAQHHMWPCSAIIDRMPFIECLLESGAKLSSSTWCAARGKFEIQLSLLRKLCQDGYFLYKQCSNEAAVYRFEYALKRIAELEQQLSSILTNFGATKNRRKHSAIHLTMRSAGISAENASIACKTIKYQTYLGLSRCERRRKFYKRALEFAQLAILVDSTSYEGFYSKAHILKDLEEIDDSLLTIDQTARLIEKTIESSTLEQKFLEQQEESLIMDTCFDLDRESCRNQAAVLAKNKTELQGNLDYLLEAKKYVAKLRQDILEDKFKLSSQYQQQLQSNCITIDQKNADISNNTSEQALLST